MKSCATFKNSRFLVRGRKSQRGAATILITLFISVAIIAVAVGILNNIQNTQQRQLAVHAQTHTQAAVWAGAEALRRYLLKLDDAGLTAFADTYKSTTTTETDADGVTTNSIAYNTIKITGVLDGVSTADTLEAFVVSKIANYKSDGTTLDGTYNLTINMTAKDVAAGASTVLQLIFNVTPFVPAAPYSLDASAGFYGDTSFKGDATLHGDEIGNLNVKGNLFAGGSIGGAGLKNVKVTGDAIFTGTVSAEKITANGNVILNGSSAASIEAAGYPGLGKGNIILLSATTHATDLVANGNILIENTSIHNDVKARGKIETTNEVKARNLIAATNEVDPDKYFLVELEPNQTLEDVMDAELAAGTHINDDSVTYKITKDNLFPYIDGYLAGTTAGYSEDYLDSLDAKFKTLLGGNLDFVAPLDPEQLDVANFPARPRNTIEFGGGILGTLAVGTLLPKSTPFAVTEPVPHEFNGSIEPFQGAYKLSEVIYGKVQALGAITRSQGVVHGDIVSETAVDCGAVEWNPIADAEGNRFAKAPAILPAGAKCAPANSAAAQVLDPTDSIFTPLSPFVMPPPPSIDAWDHKESVNYAFEPDPVEPTKTLVTVRSVNGIAGSTYYLGSFDNEEREYLCKEVNASNKCVDADGAVVTRAESSTIEHYPMCGSGTANGCFSYDPVAKTWALTAQGGLAPGTLWFMGDVTVTIGNFFNTFVVTGNFTASGDVQIAAPNFVLVEPICNNATSFEHTGATSVTVALGARALGSEFLGQIPTTVCSLESGSLVYTPEDDLLANIAVMAGGDDPVTQQFVGGIVKFAGSADILGLILASDAVNFSADTKVFGYVVAAGKGGTANVISSGATIDSTNLPAHMRVVKNGNKGQEVLGATKFLWSSYL